MEKEKYIVPNARSINHIDKSLCELYESENRRTLQAMGEISLSLILDLLLLEKSLKKWFLQAV